MSILRYLKVAAFSVLGAHIYNIKRTGYNAFVKAPLPTAYFAHGDANSACTLVRAERLKYCEDGIFWHSQLEDGTQVDRVIASCDPGRKQWNTVMGPLLNPEPKGDLWLLSTDMSVQPTPLVLENFPAGLDFHPLGMDVYPQGPGEPSILFVVNHGRQYTSVEKFHLHQNPVRLEHVKHIYHPMLWSANNVAAISPTAFYATLDHFWTRRGLWPFSAFLPILESVLVLPLGIVTHVDFSSGEIQTSIAAKGIPFANGIALSKDKSEVVVASTSASEIRLYEVNPQTFKLKYKTTIDTPFNVDNVDYTEAGTIIAAGHPHFPSVTAVSKGKKEFAPSWAVEISNRTESGVTKDAEDASCPYPAKERINAHADFGLETLYMSDGSVLSTSSSALWDDRKGRLYVFGLYGEGVLVCNRAQ